LALTRLKESLALWGYLVKRERGNGGEGVDKFYLFFCSNFYIMNYIIFKSVVNEDKWIKIVIRRQSHNSIEDGFNKSKTQNSIIKKQHHVFKKKEVTLRKKDRRHQ